VDRRDRRLQWTVEIVIIAVTVASALIFGGRTYRTNLASAEFYQSFFGPALNLACNATLNETQASLAVQDFLAFKSRTLGSCEGFQGLPTRKIDALQASMRYLEFMSAGAWKMLGVS